MFPMSERVEKMTTTCCLFLLGSVFVCNLIQPAWSQSASLPTGRQNMSAAELRQYYVPRDTPIAFLDSVAAFEGLTRDEKCYVHHLSRASWLGALIDLYQTSFESPAIFLVLQNVFRSENISSLRSRATIRCNFTTENWDSFMAYAAVFYENLGNYYDYGMSKMIPEVDLSKLDCLIESVAASAQKKSRNVSSLRSLWKDVRNSIVRLQPARYRHLGFPPDGVTTYFSANCNAGDAKVVNEYLVTKSFEAWNSRVIKTVDGRGRSTYDIRLASALKSNGSVDGVRLGVLEELRGYKYVFTRGGYSPLLVRVIEELRLAINCAGNKLEKAMTDNFVESFLTGSVAAHKNASSIWVKNQDPVIESYIGFIETYQDPNGMRGSFEGFVSVVDKEKSARFARLVNSAESFLPLLPWPREFEKDKFLRPDFTDLTVISFANGGPPAGINLPNYDEIRQADGFKNVNLGNIIAATIFARPMRYLREDDVKLLTAGRLLTFDIIVGLHELLGHGSGKLFNEFTNGSMDFDPEKISSVPTLGKVETWYKPGETYGSKFGSLGGSLEECRADAVAAYLSLFPEVLKIWELNETAAEHYGYLVWLDTATEGLDGLAQYDPEKDSWGEAHTRGRFAILRVMIDSGTANVTVINGSNGKPDLLMQMDRGRLQTDGKKAIGKFLLTIQFYKSTGNVEMARKFYDSYTSLRQPANAQFLEWHRIAVDRKEPRAIIVQPNTVMTYDQAGDVHLTRYNASAEGMVQSFLDRFSDPILEEEMVHLIESDRVDFFT